MAATPISDVSFPGVDSLVRVGDGGGEPGTNLRPAATIGLWMRRGAHSREYEGSYPRMVDFVRVRALGRRDIGRMPVD